MSPPSDIRTSRSANWFQRLFAWSMGSVSRALSRFPFAAGMVAIIAVVINLLLEDADAIGETTLVRLVAALSTAAAGSVVVELLMESRRASASARLGVSFLAALVAGAVVWTGWTSFLFPPPLIAAVVLMIPLAPHVIGSTPGRFWTFTVWTLFGVSLGFVSVMLFVIGVSAILEMIRYLFGVGLGSKSYTHIYATAATLVGPLFALARIPPDFDEEPSSEQSSRATTGLRVLQEWISAPLILTAATVIHLYAVKILVTGNVPKNQIGWIVGAFALFVLTQRLLAEPFLRGGGLAVRAFARSWAGIPVVPLVLLTVALFQRLESQGVTAERYYLALAGLAATVILVAQLVPRLRGDIRIMAAVPLCLLVASSFGSLGASSTVARSQLGLIRQFFPIEGGFLRTAGLSEAERDVLRSRLHALNDVNALDRLMPLLDVSAGEAFIANPDNRERFATLLARLGLDYGRSSTTTFTAGKSAPFDVAGYDRVYVALSSGETQASPDARVVALNGSKATIRLEDGQDRIDLSGILAKVPSAAPDGAALEPIVADIVTAGGRHVRLRLHLATFNSLAGSISMATFDLAVRRAEWAR